MSQTPDILREEYLDVYEDIQSEILNTTRFNENSDLSTIYLGKADRRFAVYSSPVMLISRKLTKDKRVVTDFRHIIMRIAKKQSGLSTT